MRRNLMCSWAGALLFVAAFMTANIGRAEMETAATVLSPKADAIVGRVAEVVFETKKPGVPLVFVSAEDKTIEWWVQPTPKTTEPGKYAVAAHFGNSQTPQGKPFQVMVVMAPNEAAAKAMVERQVFSQLPKGAVTSEPVRLLRRFETDATVKQTVVTSPAVVVKAVPKVVSVEPAVVVVEGAPKILLLNDRAKVARRQEVRGTATGEIDPVILVRANAADTLWWVQDRVKRNAAGEFTAIVRFGNDKTRAGSEFHMVALTPRSTSEAATFKVGTSMAELPKDALVSTKMTLVLAEDKIVGAE